MGSRRTTADDSKFGIIWKGRSRYRNNHDAHHVCGMDWIPNYIFEFATGMAIGRRTHGKNSTRFKNTQICNIWKHGNPSFVELLANGNFDPRIEFKES